MTEEPSKTPEVTAPQFDPQDTASIEDFFRKTAVRPMSLANLAGALGLGDGEQPALQKALTRLVEDGRLIETRDKRFGLPEKMNLVVGTLSCNDKGYGFVVPRDPSQRDLYIPRRKLGDAMHGDLVVARREDRRGSRVEGRIIRLLSRARTQVVGVYEKGAHIGYVVPLDRRMLHQVFIPEAEANGAVAGQVVAAEITNFPGGKGRRNPEGRVVEVLGERDDPRIDVEVIIREHGLPHEFPAEVVAEAEKISTEVQEEDLAGRTDFRDLPVVTIDGENAQDFDDAVRVAWLPSGNFELAVHIADVAAYVAPGSAIDREAQRRATSVYFPDRVVPMLPERLSNEICSLKPGVDRLVHTVVMEINPEGRTVNYEFHDGVLRSAERMTYKSVAALLEGSDDDLAEQHAEHIDHIRLMAELAAALRGYRARRGSIDFDLPVPELLINLRGEVEDVLRSERNDAHRIIEEFMIRANEVVASHLTWEDVATLYRVHDGPDAEKVEGFREFVTGLGLHLGGGARPRSRDFQRLVEQLEGQPGSRVIVYMMLRTMKQARYQPENVGHFGLASERYTHFTSPIRRYPDLVAHRILRFDRGSETGPALDFEALEGDLVRIGAESSERERNAEEAERRYVDWKSVQFMADKVGDSFEAYVTGVHSYGMFVELEPYFVEGLVHVSSLEDDYYHYDERQHRLEGKSSGRVFALGNRVRVQLVRADQGRRRLDFALEEGPLEPAIVTRAPAAEEPAQEPAPARRRRRRRRKRTGAAAAAGEPVPALEPQIAESAAGASAEPAVEATAAPDAAAETGRRRRRRRRAGRRAVREDGGARGRKSQKAIEPEAKDSRKSATAGRRKQDAKAAPERRKKRRGTGKTRSRNARSADSSSRAVRSKRASDAEKPKKEEAATPRVNPYLTDL